MRSRPNNNTRIKSKKSIIKIRFFMALIFVSMALMLIFHIIGIDIFRSSEGGSLQTNDYDVGIRDRKVETGHENVNKTLYGSFPRVPIAASKFSSSVSSLTISFEMSEKMATSWMKSSERVTFSVQMKAWRDDDNEDKEDYRRGVKSIDKERDVMSVDAAATFYGKSSLKLKYTKRRSIEVKLNRPLPSIINSNNRGTSGTTPYSGAKETPEPIQHFLLLSLWEDEYRLAYLSATSLLRKVGLFFSHAELVELKCTTSSRYSSPNAEKVCGNKTSRTTLGVYLLVEYPSAAIHRQYHTSSGNESDDVMNTKEHQGTNNKGINLHSLRQQRICEPPEDYKKRIAFLDKLSAESSIHHPVNVDIGNRNWFYFEKPPIYDILFVPSFKRNSRSTLSKVYRDIERNANNIRDSTSDISSYLFDINHYMIWLAINTILRNGDYDDEVFFYGVSSSTASGRGYYTVMAWDYDTIFSPCHRNGRNAIKTSPEGLMFCAETPIEEKIINTPILKKEYINIVKCVLNNIATTEAWEDILRQNSAVLKRLLRRPGVSLATFGLPSSPDLISLNTNNDMRDGNIKTGEEMISKGYSLLLKKFRQQHALMLSIVEAGTPSSSVPGSQSSLTFRSKETKNTFTEDMVNASKRKVIQHQQKGYTDEQDHQLLHQSYSAESVLCSSLLKGDLSSPAAANMVKLFHSRIILPEHKHHPKLMFGNNVAVSPIDKEAMNRIQSIWTPDGAEHLATSPLTIPDGGAGLYCATVSLSNLSGGKNDNSPLSCLLPFVVRDKVRGKAEFAVMPYRKPTLRQIAYYPSKEEIMDIQLNCITPAYWPSGAPFPVIAKVMRKSRDIIFSSKSSGCDGCNWNVVRENFILQKNKEKEETVDDALSRPQIPPVMLSRGFSAFYIIPQIIKTNKTHYGIEPYMVHIPGTSSSGSQLIHVAAVSPNSTESTSSVSASLALPLSIPPNSWVSLSSYVTDVKSSSNENKEEKVTENHAKSPPTGRAVFIELKEPLVLKRGQRLVINGSMIRPTTDTRVSVIIRMHPGVYIEVPHGAAVELEGVNLEDPLWIIPATEPFNGQPSDEAGETDRYRGSFISPRHRWNTILVKGGSLRLKHVVIMGSGVSTSSARRARGHSGDPAAQYSGTGKHHTHSAAVTAVGEGSTVEVAHTYFLNLLGPAFAAGGRASVVVDHSLIQWAQMGIECLNCDFTSRHSVWTQFPHWGMNRNDRQEDKYYVDEDNDGMYLSGGTHIITDTTVSHTEDDGIDSGTLESSTSKSNGGSLIMQRTIVEMVRHEGVALSSSHKSDVRNVSISKSAILHAQQGIESGYSGKHHITVIRDGVLIGYCGVGLRYGDNYYRDNEGSLNVMLSSTSSSIILANNNINAINYVRMNALGISPNFHVIREEINIDSNSSVARNRSSPSLYSSIIGVQESLIGDRSACYRAFTPVTLRSSSKRRVSPKEIDAMVRRIISE